MFDTQTKVADFKKYHPVIFKTCKSFIFFQVFDFLNWENVSPDVLKSSMQIGLPKG